MLLDRPFPLNDETFARTIESAEVPVLVDFYADWCGPCKMMAPSVDELAATYQGRALVAKLDTDRAQRTASGFNIRGIPTTIVFKGGREVTRQTGRGTEADAREDDRRRALTDATGAISRLAITSRLLVRRQAAPSSPDSPAPAPRRGTATT